MRNILLIALGELSTGELIIANEFTRNINEEKYRLDILIPRKRLGLIETYKKGKKYFLTDENSWKENREIVKKIFENNKYELIIFFDVYTFEYAQKWTGIDIDFMINLNIPLASIDEYNYLSSDFKIDYYGLIVKKLPNLIDRMGFILRNCPLSMPSDQKRNPKEHFYQVLPENENCIKNIMTTREKHAVKDEKLVFFTLSDWELNGAYSFVNHRFLMDSLLPIIYGYLKDTNLKIHLIHVGANKWNFLKAQNENVRYTYFSGLPIEEFESLLAASDLYITYNLVSITLTKAIEFGVPSVVLNNDKILDFNKFKTKLKEKPLWYQKIANHIGIVYPFTASMFGWYYFLKPVMKNNIYMDTFYRLQTFKTAEVSRVLLDILNSGNSRKEKIQEYKEKKEMIPEPEEVLDNIFEEMEKRY